MKLLENRTRAGRACLLASLALATAAAAAGAAPSFAQEEGAAVASPEAPPADALTPEERRLREREARIEEYLRKKEEKRARQDAGVRATETSDEEAAALARAQAMESAQIEATQEQGKDAAATGASAGATTAAVAEPSQPAAQSAAKPTAEKVEKKARQRALPRDLAKAQASVRATPLAADETVQEYLDRIDRQEASPHQLAAFANFLADNGLVHEAVTYYDVALRLESQDPTLWVNAGTLQRKLGRTGPALSAYHKALELAPNNALAHYNIGSVLDSQGKYKEAVLSFKTALSIDPSLGDPVYNPQAANNDLLVAVKLMLYQEQSGSLGLPLSDVPPHTSSEPAQGQKPR